MKKNPFLIAFGAGVVVIGGILAYLVFSAYSNFNNVSAEYDAQVTKLQSLQNRSPFPNSENIKKYAELTKAFHAEYDKMVAELQKMQPPAENPSPQGFQDKLRSVVSEIEARAKEAGTKLPDGFYMGFDQYRDTPPSPDSTGALSRQLNAMKAVVDILLEYRVNSIDSIRRDPGDERDRGSRGGSSSQPPTSGRTGSSQSGGRPPSSSQPQGGGDRDRGSSSEGVVNRFPFDIVFTGEQLDMRQALNSIASADQFFIIRTLAVQNSETQGPSRNIEIPEATPPPPPPVTYDSDGNPLPAPTPAEAEEPPKPTFTVLVGRETVRVAARIEMVTINAPSLTK